MVLFYTNDRNFFGESEILVILITMVYNESQLKWRRMAFSFQLLSALSL
ncbi:hypothetical protein CLOSTMETH_02660 [[Clostridium] methylpentosum DSM 5476]|uniref:Uncharacterized protein n=1 Tax=[Clostridium] methylpentosum DSM 5476 TaxID=537013 RepID=C0EFL8_9FIRM|nr:hypothetical protein CLOSTMETH_02660 [[Clostridium] methylpentosum DSM 5476]